MAREFIYFLVSPAPMVQGSSQFPNSFVYSSSFHFCDGALYLPEHKTLVCSDLHLGYEYARSLNDGIFLPPTNLSDLKQRLTRLFLAYAPKQFLVLGDLMHSFGKAHRPEWNEIKDFFLFLKRFFPEGKKSVILIKGNHDVGLRTIATAYGFSFVEKYQLGTSLFTHGHQYVSVPT
ncbi:MAG: metallophosphoesterase, partial [Candidatus Woesearchaeota archaeon]